MFAVVALTGVAAAQDPMPPGTDATAVKPADSSARPAESPAKSDTADAVKPIKVADKHKAKHKTKHKARKHKKSHRHAAHE